MECTGGGSLHSSLAAFPLLLSLLHTIRSLPLRVADRPKA